MVLIRALITILILSGCSKLNYVYEQGVGQIKLISNAKENSKILSDATVSEEIKTKIRNIEEYKTYFYYFFSKDRGEIYSKTTFLEQKAVTHLVISSPYQRIKAEDSCFPFVGCFPYIGFFEKKSALKYVQKKENELKHVYMRPVYAYSTLGYFDDAILSSFFNYDKFDLAELIFHELFHTIFFVKGEVDLNENLANYFGKKLRDLYFEGTSSLQEFHIESQKNKKLNKLIVKLSQTLSGKYKLIKKGKKSDYERELQEFLEGEFYPQVYDKCQELKISSCYPLKKMWNNARFAAFLTYEKKQNNVKKLHQKLQVDLIGFYEYIANRYNEYENNSSNKTFEDYLLLEE